MPTHLSLSIFIAVCVTFGLFLFSKALPGREKKPSGILLSGVLLLVTLLMLLLGSLPLVIAFIVILWLSGALFPQLIDHSSILSLLSFSLLFFVLIIVYELLIEPFFKGLLRQANLPFGWLVVPELLATILLLQIISTVFITNVILSFAGVLFVGLAVVTLDHFLEKLFPEKRIRKK